MPHVPDAILFDGTTDFLLRGNLTGVADGKTGTFSTWVREDVPQGVQQFILSNTNNRVSIRLDAVDLFNIVLQNSAGSNVLSGMQVASVPIVAGVYHHLLISWDLGNALVKFFIDDVDRTNVSPTIVDDFVAYSQANWSSGGSVAGAQKLSGATADLYFTTEFIDLSVEANRRKFIDAAGNPVFLGVSGEEPTGSPAAIYLRGNQTDQGINSGRGGDFVSQATQVPGETAGPVTNATSSASGLVNGLMFHELESAAGYITGPAFRMGSNGWTNQFVAPGALCSLEGSNDKLNWRIMADTFNNPISALADVMRVGRDRPAWLRFIVATDAMEPRLFTSIIQNQKLQEEGR